MAEAVVGEHLFRTQGRRENVVLFFSDKREVDFVSDYPVEVKWKTNVGRDDLRDLFAFGHGLLLVKTEFKEMNERYLVAPLALVLAMCDAETLLRKKFV